MSAAGLTHRGITAYSTPRRLALIVADRQRSDRLEAGGCTIPAVALEVDQPIEQALAPLLGSETGAALPGVAPEDPATLLFTSGSTGDAKGALSSHRAVTTGVYAYTLGLAILLVIKEGMGDPPLNPPKTLVNVPLFHVTGLIGHVTLTLLTGAPLVLFYRFDVTEACRLVALHRATFTV